MRLPRWGMVDVAATAQAAAPNGGVGGIAGDAEGIATPGADIAQLTAILAAAPTGPQ